MFILIKYLRDDVYWSNYIDCVYNIIYGLFVLINNPGIYRDGVLQLHMLVGLMARSQT